MLYALLILFALYTFNQHSRMANRESSALPICKSTPNDEKLNQMFILKAVDPKSDRKLEAIVSFGPTTYAHIPSVSTIPTYNANSSHKMPSFSLPSQFPTHPYVVMKIHRNFMKSYYGLEEKEKIVESQYMQMVAKPNASMCAVCKTSFEDYLTHIKSNSHTKNMQDNPYCQRIIELCNEFASKEPEIMISEPAKLEQRETTEEQAQSIAYYHEYLQHFNQYNDHVPVKRMPYQDSQFQNYCAKTDQKQRKNRQTNNRKTKEKLPKMSIEQMMYFDD